MLCYARLSYHDPETICFTTYPCYGNFNRTSLTANGILCHAMLCYALLFDARTAGDAPGARRSPTSERLDASARPGTPQQEQVAGCALGLQVYKYYLLWALQYINMTYEVGFQYFRRVFLFALVYGPLF